MTEEVKRLEPKQDVLRELFLKSGNLCAFPECNHLMMNAEGTFIGQVCHIEAAGKEGQRFNSAMTNEERRAFSNLLLMCHRHHKETDDVDKYPVVALKKLKADHEAKFSSPSRAMRGQFKDWTKADDPHPPENLKRMDSILKWGYSEDDLRGSAEWVKGLVEKIAKVPVRLRSFLGEAIMRTHRMRDSGVVRAPRNACPRILLLDLQEALQVSEEEVLNLAAQLEDYGLCSVDEMNWSEDRRPALIINDLNGWNFWSDLAEFCTRTNEPIAAFTEELDYSRLDL